MFFGMCGAGGLRAVFVRTVIPPLVDVGFHKNITVLRPQMRVALEHLADIFLARSHFDLTNHVEMSFGSPLVI